MVIRKISRKLIIPVLVSLFLFTGCNTITMNFNLISKQELKEIPSASGIEYVDSNLYVIGDNSPWLFKLDEKFEILDRYQLLTARSLPDSIFEKIVKPDFEAMCRFEKQNKIFVFGSGSKSPERDVLVEINLSDEFAAKEYSLERFYRGLKASAKLTDAELNIEGAEVVNDQLYLLNRGRNLLLRYSLQEFLNSLEDSGEIPEPEIFDFELPEIRGIEAGFSGVSYAPEINALIFTATVEDTDNWIDDGEVLGSYIGMISLENLGEDLSPQAVTIKENGETLLIKIESITVLPPFNETDAEILLVTDSDGGESEILHGKFSF